MNPAIKKILDELYAVDESLRKVSGLDKTIAELLKMKPDTLIDEVFVASLKQRLQRLPVPEAQPRRQFQFHPWVWGGSFAFGGAVLALLVVLIISHPASNRGLNFDQPRISRLSANAFGDLHKEVQKQTSPQIQSAPQALVPSGGANGPVGGGVGPLGLGGGGGMMGKMMPYQPYRFVYQGAPLELKDQNLDVYRRKISGMAVNPGTLMTLKIGGLDLSTFENSNLGNFELRQNTDHGYMIYVNAGDGTVSISQNWDTWYRCPNGVCPILSPLQSSDLLSDRELISLANQFVGAHHINLQNYGQPQVDNSWKNNPGEGYVPDSISVLYPLQLNGETVYESSGEIKALRVTVDLRGKQVSGLWGLETQDYEVSSYPAETATGTIIKTAESGGLYGGIGNTDPNAAKVGLGTPDRVLVSAWSNGEQFILPALRFPVASTTAPSYAPKNVIVPLVKGLLPVNQPVPLDQSAPAQPPQKF